MSGPVRKPLGKRPTGDLNRNVQITSRVVVASRPTSKHPNRDDNIYRIRPRNDLHPGVIGRVARQVVSANSSRPISQRLISEVPAPIS